MLIFFKARIVLFAIEKTATSALQDALQREADVRFMDVGMVLEKHLGFADYKKLVEPGLLDKVDGPLDYVGVFRDPVTWLNSWYRYRLREADAGKPESTRGITYEQFAIDFCRKPWDRPPHAWITPQSKRVCDAEGKVGINRLFRYDDMESMIRFLERRLGHAIAVDRVNVSPSSKERELSAETLDLYRRSFPLDFEIYNSLPPHAGD